MEQLKKQTPEQTTRIVIAVKLLNSEVTIERAQILSSMVKEDKTVAKIVEVYC